MKAINLETKQNDTISAEKILNKNNRYFVCCTPNELIKLQPMFNFDMSTVEECLILDEKIRLSTYPGYDFVSFVYFYLDKEMLYTDEINCYLGENYLVLVLPESVNAIDEIINAMITKIGELSYTGDICNRLYYQFFDEIIMSFSKTLEETESEINKIDGKIRTAVNAVHFEQIAAIKQNIYLIRKYLRPLIYIGDLFLVNENGLVTAENMRYFNNLDLRFNKLYDFSANLQEYAEQTRNAYDSKISMQTNDIVTKLTVLTIFFGPLTVITGIYGMNFKYMPEILWPFGYAFAIGLMILVTAIVYIILKVKKWW